MTDIVDELRSNSALPICPFDKRSPEYWTTPNDKPCKFCGSEPEGPDKCTGADMRIMAKAASEIERIRAGYERLARHIAPDVEAEYIWSHLPEQIIDAGLQIQESALSEARATGRREGMEWSAQYHDDLAAEHEACGWESQHHEMMVREHRRFAAAIRAAMEKAE